MDAELSPLTGSWSDVEGYGQTYINTASAIEEAIVLMRAVRESGGQSLAVQEVARVSKDVDEKISRATSRYEVAGTALKTYSEELRTAQQWAETAIEQALDAQSRLAAAKSALETLEAVDDPTPEVLTQVSEQQATVAAIGGEVTAAIDGWYVASDKKNSAAEAAETAIRNELEDSGLNDSFWDDFWGGVGDVFSFIGDFLVGVVRFVVAVVAAIVIVSLLVIAGMLLLTFSGAFGDKADLAILGSAALVAFAVTWISTGAFADFIVILVREGLSLEALKDAGIGSVIAWATRFLPSVAESLIDGDAGAPVLISKTNETTRTQLPQSAGDILAALQRGNMDVDTQPDFAQTDELNAENSSQVSVTAVQQPDGSLAYRVNIPSTQSWEPGSLSINDVESDAAAKLSPTPTQLEMAVRDAMDRAGVPEGADVLLSGWSLGGITAGNLAADPDFTSQYNVEAVVVMGASVEDQDIPESIPVLDIAHEEDVVQRTEDASKPWRGGDGNRTQVTVPVGPDPGNVVGHSGDAYLDTVQAQGDVRGSQAQEFVERNELDRFFATEESTWSYRYQQG